MVMKQYDVWMIQLNPTLGTEIQKARPCLIVSPTAANNFLQRAVVVPLTSQHRNLPTRITCQFQKRQGQLVIDQMRAVDQQRFISNKKRGRAPRGLFLHYLLNNY